MTIQDLSFPVLPEVRAGTPGRWPATAVFFLNGLTLSTYIVRMPSLKDQHQLSDGQLGAIGVLFAVSALTCMQFVGPLVARVGSRPVLRASLLVMPVMLVLVGVVGGPIGLAAAVTVLGAVHGVTDAAMNAHAVTVERFGARPILNGCHAAWSLSAVIASLATGVLAHRGVPVTVHFTVAAAVLLAGGLALGPLLLPAAADRLAPSARICEQPADSRSCAPAPGDRHPGWRDGWSRTVIALGLTGTAIMVCEGAALGWGPIFVHESRGGSLSLAAAAFTAYTAGETGGRLVGDRATMRAGAPLVFRIGALVAACGLAVVLVGPGPALTVGFAVMGLGASVLIPLTFSAVGARGASADGTGTATLVSRLTTFTYAGILLGPAMIGWTAELVGLTWTLAGLVPVLFCLALLTRLPDQRS